MDTLLYVDGDAGMEKRCQVALDLARVCGGHIECLQPTATQPLISNVDFGAADLLAKKASDAQRHKDALREATISRLGSVDVSWGYRAVNGDPIHMLTEAARLVDLVVLNATRQSSALNGVAPSAGEVVGRLEVPVLAIPPGDMPFNPTGPALIAWDGSAQCGHAIRGALELLKAAATIVIVTVGQVKTDLHAEQAQQYLGHHQLPSQIVALPDVGQSISTSLLEAQSTFQAGYMVMGAYGHSRARELLLGGVTREMLATSPIPILMAH